MIVVAPCRISSRMIADPAAPDPGDHDRHVGDVLVHHAQRVDQRGEHHDRGAVLIIVEDRDVQLGPQPFLDLEAARRGDVLQVDPAVDRGDRLDDLDDLVRVLGVQADRPGVHPGEPLEQRRLPFHHRQCRSRADVAQPEHGRAVGDHGHGVPLDRQPPGVSRVLRDGQADPGHPGGVRAGEVVAVPQRHLRVDLDLAAEVQQEGPVRHLADAEALLGRDGLGDRLRVGDVTGVAGHVDHEHLRRATPPRRAR